MVKSQSDGKCKASNRVCINKECRAFWARCQHLRRSHKLWSQPSHALAKVTHSITGQWMKVGLNRLPCKKKKKRVGVIMGNIIFQPLFNYLMWLCQTGSHTLLVPEIVKKRCGKCRQRRIHPSQTQAGWCDSARPPLHRRMLPVGKLPGWQRKRAREVVKNGVRAGRLSPPRGDCENTRLCY